MLRRLCVALTLGILMLAALAQGAAADPSGAKNSLTFPAACGGQTVQFVVNGNGDFTPGHVVGSTAVYVLQSFTITFEFTPTGGETMSETAARSKGNVHGDLVTCSFDVTQEFPDGTFHFFGSATGFFTPAS
jgi:ABC-type glycerol-3-phosphate transport system substrate-binding protein